MFFLSGIVFSQEYNLKFKNIKFVGHQKIIEFSVANSKKTIDNNSLITFLNQDEKIFKSKIKGSHCILVIDKSVDADYVFNLISQKGYDFDYKTISKVKSESIKKDEEILELEWKNEIKYQKIKAKNNLPDSYPKREFTGDAKRDEMDYAEKLRKWKETNPEEWQKLLDNRKK